MFFRINFSSKSKISHEDRKKYISALYGSWSDGKNGFIDKFNNAIGFKDVSSDYASKYPVVIPPKFSSPENYETPSELLCKHFPSISLNSNELFSLYVEDGFEYHPNSRFSYKHKDIAIKFCAFCQKVFPNLEISFESVNKIPDKLAQRVLNYFYSCLDNDMKYTIECSSPRLLTDNELRKIKEVLNNLVDYKFDISQFFCDTCYNYNNHAPYHIQIDYLD